nr:permease [Helicobacter apodemus]
MPFFQALVRNGVHLSVSFAYLLTSPLINLILISMLFITFGFTLGLSYMCFVILAVFFLALSLKNANAKFLLKEEFFTNFPTKSRLLRGKGSFTLSPKSHFSPHLEQNTAIKFHSQAPQVESKAKRKILQSFFTSSFINYKKILPFLAMGMAIWAFIHDFVPQDSLQEILTNFNYLDVIMAAFIGIFLYIRVEVIIPISLGLINAGVPLGIVMDLLIAGGGCSLPELIVLKSMFKTKLICLFVANGIGNLHRLWVFGCIVWFVRKKMKILDKLLPLWIFLSATFGLTLGIYFPPNCRFYQLLEFNDINLALALGLIIMLYRPLAKANYTHIFKVFSHKKILFVSLGLNLLMFALAFLAYLFLPNFTLAYMQGIILIGLARCIAMVLIWIDLALGDKELALSLVAFNSFFQIFFFGIMAYVFMIVLPSFLGINLQGYTLSFAFVAKNVAVYLGIPFILGFLIRFILVKYKGAKFYEENFIAKISPITLIFLLYIVIVMFSYKGGSLLKLPFDTLLVALPLVAYFVVMFFIAFYLSKNFGYEKKLVLSVLSLVEITLNLALPLPLLLLG